MKRVVCWLWMITTTVCVVLVASSISRADSPANAAWVTYRTTHGLASDAVLAIAVGEETDIWIGTIGGVSHFDGHRWATYTRGHGLAEDWVTSLAVDAEGRVWCGTYGSGLSLWEKGRWISYNHKNSGLTNDWITALAVDESQRLWIGTFGGGVNLFDGRSWITYTAANSHLPTDWITCLAIGKREMVWVGTEGKGLCILDAGRGFCYTSENSGLANDYVTALLVALDGRVWIGTEEGVSAFDPADNVWWRWREKEGGAGQRVHALALDEQGQLWVGTGKGIRVYDRNAWTRLATARGLADQVISAIAADKAGNVWLGTLGGGVSRYGPRDVQPMLPPRPVILVHGWRGPDSDRLEDSEFVFLKRWLERDGHTVFYATGIHPDNTLHENARRLREDIARAKAATGSPTVDVIAFSMGGLNTRAYIESSLYDRDVHQVFIIGTPQAGVQMWKTFLLHEIAHWSAEPSARELLPEHVKLFNETHVNAWQVPYRLVAGAARGKALPPLFGFLPPSDGLISAWSAHALRGPAVRYITTDDLHAWSSETILLEIPSFLWPQDTYNTYLRQALREEEALPGSALPSDWEPLPAEEHSPLFSGEISPGQTVTHSLEIDAPGTIRVYARWQRDELTFTLRSPSGKIVDSRKAGEEKKIAYFALPSANFASYVITDTVTGTWACQLRAPSKLRKPVGYAIYAVLDSPLALRTTVDREWYHRGEHVVMRATVTDADKPVLDAKVSAEIYLPDHRRIALVLHDDGQHSDDSAGDGVYGNSWQAAGPGGYYPFFVSAMGISAGRRFAHGSEGVIVVSPDTASLTGAYQERAEDDDHDGRYERLAIYVGVNVVQEGEFLLAAKLLGQSGEEIAAVAMPVMLRRGVQGVTLSFPGGLIRRHRLDGPYVVDHLTVLDVSGAALKLDQAAAWQTKAYAWQDFAAP